MKKKLDNIYSLFTGKELGILPGNLAYSFFLAIIPILSIVFYFLTTFHFSASFLQDFLNRTFPPNVVEILEPVFSTNITTESILSVCLSVIVMTNGCNAIILASNTIFNFENAHIVKRMIKSLFLSIVIIILIAFMLIVPLFGRSIINLIGHFTSFIGNNKEFIDSLYAILQVPVSLIVMFLIIKLIYIIAPDEKVLSKYVNKGAIFTTVSWLIVTIGFSYYISNIARFDRVYGNLANIVIMLFWFYILAYIFVIGLYLNKRSSDAGIEKTNTIKLEEIRRRVNEEKRKK